MPATTSTKDLYPRSQDKMELHQTTSSRWSDPDPHPCRLRRDNFLEVLLKIIGNYFMKKSEIQRAILLTDHLEFWNSVCIETLFKQKWNYCMMELIYKTLIIVTGQSRACQHSAWPPQGPLKVPIWWWHKPHQVSGADHFRGEVQVKLQDTAEVFLVMMETDSVLDMWASSLIQHLRWPDKLSEFFGSDFKCLDAGLRD